MKVFFKIFTKNALAHSFFVQNMSLWVLFDSEFDFTPENGHISKKRQKSLKDLVILFKKKGGV